MPELPEVETIVESLLQGKDGAPPLVGMRIEGATLRWPRHVGAPSPSTFRRRIRGQTIRGISRRGKYVAFSLDRATLLIHLMMSGELKLVPPAAPEDRFERTVLHLNGGWDLRFCDSRKFGKVFLLDDPGPILAALGPEPLDPSFTAEALASRLASRRRALKPLLLDQAFLAGLGNIYADESLHRARLHPLRRSDSLSPNEVHDLWRGIREALNDGLRHNGASIDWVYRGGDFQNHFRVYQRTGEPCPVCGEAVERIVVGQRSTHFCPSCQRERDG